MSFERLLLSLKYTLDLKHALSASVDIDVFETPSRKGFSEYIKGWFTTSLGGWLSSPRNRVFLWKEIHILHEE